jgi:hypothetical protein
VRVVGVALRREVDAAPVAIDLMKPHLALEVRDAHGDSRLGGAKLRRRGSKASQPGVPHKRFELLQRHFYKFERYHAVREKEMMEARVDAVFDSIRHSEEFMALTKFADGKLPMVMSPRQADEMKMNMNH